VLAAAVGGGWTPQEARDESTGFREQSLSHLRLERSGHAIDVYLFAPDEKVEVVRDPYCGGDAGAKAHSGHFQLISVVGGIQVAALNLDPDDWFVEGKAHDGARLFHDPMTGQDLVAVYLYGNCSTETVQFFSTDIDGRLFSIPFLDRDGRIWKERMTGSTGAIPQLGSGALTFCSYTNYLFYDFCDAYTFDGANFQDSAKWMTRELDTPTKGLNDQGQAARALFEFLSALSAKSYTAAAFYVDINAEAQGPVPASNKNGQKVAFLEHYCTAMGGQCLNPLAMESEPSAGSGTTLLFHVELETADITALRIAGRESFDFRVAKTPGGFKVLDLPPRIP